LENLGSSSTGGGGGAGKAVFSPLTLTLDGNTGLAPLLRLAATGQHLKGATLVGVSAGDTQDKVYQLDLADVLVTKVEDDAGAGLTLSLDYSKIELETFTQNDGAADSAAATVSLTVNSVNDAPVYTSPATFAIAENGTTVGTVRATDPESNPITFATVGGVDQALFEIDPAGALRFNAPPDFETPEDANGDNFYDLVVSATDSLGAVTTQTLAIEVTNVTESGQTINGGNSNETLVGTTGNDAMNGGNGNDNLNGGDGNDSISGGNGKDILVGGRGDDNMSSGNDNDSLDGGLGNDSLGGGNGKDILTGGAGNDLLDGGNDDDVMDGGLGNDSLSGGNGDDIMDAGAGSDTLNGGNGKDTVDGGDGNDDLEGGSGNDRLAGGTGNDELTGGVGDDQLVFHTGFGHDVATDFNSRDDVIVFYDGLFGNPEAVLAASQQVGDDTVITLDANNSVVLENVSLQSLSANDFLFLN
jgi:Ca2+-binding RTX toxin-like protein